MFNTIAQNQHDMCYSNITKPIELLSLFVKSVRVGIFNLQ